MTGRGVERGGRAVVVGEQGEAEGRRIGVRAGQGVRPHGADRDPHALPRRRGAVRPRHVHGLGLAESAGEVAGVLEGADPECRGGRPQLRLLAFAGQHGQDGRAAEFQDPGDEVGDEGALGDARVAVHEGDHAPRQPGVP